MIRGVNKNVIEISDTGNECFERAILFVRPNRRAEDGEQLRRRAAEFLSGLKLRPRFYSKGRLLTAALKLSAAAIAGGCIAMLLFSFWAA